MTPEDIARDFSALGRSARDPFAYFRHEMELPNLTTRVTCIGPPGGGHGDTQTSCRRLVLVHEGVIAESAEISLARGRNLRAFPFLLLGLTYAWVFLLSLPVAFV